MVYIAVDVMGGDYAPAEPVKGCIQALNGREGFGVIMVGRAADIEAELLKTAMNVDYTASKRLVVVDAAQVIENEDMPTAAIKEKKDSSMVRALSLVKEGAASGVVSAGNTGALLVGGLTVIGRVKGVLRPALGVMLPGRNPSGFTFLIDAGANMDAKAAYLAQFAVMGFVYVKHMLGLPSPRVSLVNVGGERDKGSSMVKEAYALLESAPVNFTGNIEAKEIPLGGTDVAVCDAFVGNILLKHSEGLSKALLSTVKDELMKSPVSKLGAALSRKAFANVKKGFDASEVGGAPFLGLTGLLVKAHGSSDAKAVMNAVYQAVSFAEKGIVKKIESGIAESAAGE